MEAISADTGLALILLPVLLGFLSTAWLSWDSILALSAVVEGATGGRPPDEAISTATVLVAGALAALVICVYSIVCGASETPETGSVPSKDQGSFARMPSSCSENGHHAAKKEQADCCFEGLWTLYDKPKPRSAKPVTQTESEVAAPKISRTGITYKSSRVVQVGPRTKDGHPDFSGSWKLVEVTGQADEVLADLGIKWAFRKVIAAMSFGVGKVARHYEHNGSHIKLKESGLEENEQEFDITGEEQTIPDKDPFLQITYWDPEDPNVMVFDTMDPAKVKQQNWSTNRQYFVSEDKFTIETTSRGGHVVDWIYQAQVAK